MEIEPTNYYYHMTNMQRHCMHGHTAFHRKQVEMVVR